MFLGSTPTHRMASETLRLRIKGFFSSLLGVC